MPRPAVGLYRALLRGGRQFADYNYRYGGSVAAGRWRRAGG